MTRAAAPQHVAPTSQSERLLALAIEQDVAAVQAHRSAVGHEEGADAALQRQDHGLRQWHQRKAAAFRSQQAEHDATAEALRVGAALISGSSERRGPAPVLTTLVRVGQQYGVSHEELTGNGRAAVVCQARQAAMYALASERKDPTRWRWSLQQIGKALGGRDHSTVVHGIRAHAERTGLPQLARSRPPAPEQESPHA